MPVAADFRVVNDLPHKLATGQEISFVCEIPPNVSHGGAQPKSVIFVKFLLEGASGLTWELHLNGTGLLTFSGSGSDLITTMEAFDAKLLLTGENRVQVKVTHGLGSVKIADIVVHYHIQI